MGKIKKLLQTVPFQTHNWITGGMALIGSLLLLIGAYSGLGYLWIYIVGLLILILTVVYSLLAFRCPHCDTRFGTRGGIPNYCPYCGEKLEK